MKIIHTDVGTLGIDIHVVKNGEPGGDPINQWAVCIKQKEIADKIVQKVRVCPLHHVLAQENNKTS